MEQKNLYSSYSSVIELKPKDFKGKTLKIKEFKDKSGLVFFYAPWCIHCQNMVKDISDLAIQFKYVFPFGAVNCENPVNHSICRKFDINMFPTMFFQTANNKLVPFSGKKDKDSLLNFIYSNTL